MIILHRFLASLIVFPLFINLNAQTHIAIVDFSGKGVSEIEASALTDRLRIELFQTGEFKVIEREMMDAILNEQDFQLSGCTSTECIVEVGKLIGVKRMVGGSISKVGDIYSVSARIISVETGEIITTATYDHRGRIGDLLTFGMKNVANALTGNTVVESIILGAKPPIPKIRGKKAFNIGIETFGLPYFSGGSGGTLWFGINHFRIRGGIANLETPSVYLRDGFENDSWKLTVFNIEYFLKKNYNGLWFGSGIGSWSGTVGHEDEIELGSYEYVRWGINVGYSYKLVNNLYINAWGGLYVLIVGDVETQVGSRTVYFDEGVPIISFDLGFYF